MLTRRLFVSALVIFNGFCLAGCGYVLNPNWRGPQNSALTINAVTLPTGYVGATYTSTTLTASGGSGSGYTWSVPGSALLPAGITFSSSGVLAGKPTAPGTTSFTVNVTDSAQASATAQLSITVKPGISITTGAALPDAYVGTAYSQTLAATGGSGSGYVWTLTSGTENLSAVGLNFANGVVSGTSTTTGTATFSVSVTDDSQTSENGTFTVRVDPGGVFPVSGQVTLVNACGGTSVPAVALTIDTNPAQTATSDSNGNYTFAGVPGGSYTITPSITGPNSIFYPASLPVTVNGAALTGQNFAATLGYEVLGSVSYAGAETGRIYVWLHNKYCSGNPVGTSITAPGPFTIEGVSPGAYDLAADLDPLGFGYQNDLDAVGMAGSGLTVTGAGATGTAITITDPIQNPLPAIGPVIDAITASDSGVAVKFEPIMGPHPVFNQVELPSSYDVQWSTDPTFATSSGTLSFKAGGSNGTGVLLLNDPSLASGNTYCFRMRGVNSAGNGNWTVYSADGAQPAGVTISAPAGNVVTGTVTFEAQPAGPLYVGYFDGQTGNFYTTRIPNPVSPQAYSVNVPNGQNYFHFAILDQNNDGMVDPGDVSNTLVDDVTPLSVTGNMTGQDLTLNTPGSESIVSTLHIKSTNVDGSVSETYSFSFQIEEGNKLPVAVRLVSGPRLSEPVDLTRCLACANNEFQYYVSSYNDRPAAGDSYHLLVTYSDGTSDTTTAQVTGVVDAFATNLAPSAASDTSLTPTFSWTNPENAGSYYYRFFLMDTQENVLWSVWGPNAYCPEFCYTINSLTWGVDPADPTNKPTVSALTPGVPYTWLIQVIDSNGNSTMQQTYYIP